MDLRVSNAPGMVEKRRAAARKAAATRAANKEAAAGEAKASAEREARREAKARKQAEREQAERKRAERKEHLLQLLKAARDREMAPRIEEMRLRVARFSAASSLLGLPGPRESFECVECGRWADVVSSGEVYSRFVQTELDFSLLDWGRVRSAALLSRTTRGAEPLRPAFLQREFGKNYDESVKTFDAAVRLGLLDATAKGVVAAQPRCSECYERRATVPESGQSAPKARDLIPPQLRFRVLQRDGFRCQYCGRSARDGAILHLDHVVPVAAGGETSEDNLITACETCNLGKSSGDVI